MPFYLLVSLIHFKINFKIFIDIYKVKYYNRDMKGAIDMSTISNDVVYDKLLGKPRDTGDCEDNENSKKGAAQPKKASTKKTFVVTKSEELEPKKSKKKSTSKKATRNTISVHLSDELDAHVRSSAAQLNMSMTDYIASCVRAVDEIAQLKEQIAKLQRELERGRQGGRPSKYTKEQIQNVVKDFDSGVTQMQIANRYGMSLSTVQRFLRESRKK